MASKKQNSAQRAAAAKREANASNDFVERSEDNGGSARETEAVAAASPVVTVDESANADEFPESTNDNPEAEVSEDERNARDTEAALEAENATVEPSEEVMASVVESEDIVQPSVRTEVTRNDLVRRLDPSAEINEDGTLRNPSQYEFRTDATGTTVEVRWANPGREDVVRLRDVL